MFGTCSISTASEVVDGPGLAFFLVFFLGMIPWNQLPYAITGYETDEFCFVIMKEKDNRMI